MLDRIFKILQDDGFATNIYVTGQIQVGEYLLDNDAVLRFFDFAENDPSAIEIVIWASRNGVHRSDDGAKIRWGVWAVDLHNMRALGIFKTEHDARTAGEATGQPYRISRSVFRHGEIVRMVPPAP